MEERSAWTCDELQNGILVFRGIRTEIGTLRAVYLGPGGAFVILQHMDDPGRCCVLLKDLLHISRLQLYAEDQGIYNAALNSFSDPLPCEEADDYARAFVDGSEAWLGYTRDDLKRMGDRLKRADAFSRGWYRTDDGRVYVRHGRVFREISDLDSDMLYYVTLFGGALGIHRFYMGKFWTGFLYLCTGGLVLTGWACDLLFLLFGIFRDKRKRLMYPPKNRLGKILFLPLGFLFSCLVLTALRMLFGLVSQSPFPQVFIG